MTLPVISLHQPWASLLFTRQPCRCVEVPIEHWRYEDCAAKLMVKRFETRSKPCLPKYIGQRILIHAAKTPPKGGDIRRVGDYWFYVGREGAWLQRGEPGDRGPSFIPGDDYALPLGAIVGSCVITANLPIVGDPSDDISHVRPTEWDDDPALTVYRVDGDEWNRVYTHETISDQLPYGDWTSGRYAWQIEQAAPVQERCPWCWGTGYTDETIPWAQRSVRSNLRDCPVCKNAGDCDPIPVTGRRGWWMWAP